MIINQYSDGSMKLHIEDEDDYAVTDDNGVDVLLTKKQVDRIKGILHDPAPQPRRTDEML